MQTFEEIRQASLARIGEFTDKYPTGTQVPFRRIGVRQQQLYAMAAHENPEYTGQCAIGTVDSGAVDLTSMSPPVATPERISLIKIYELNDAERPPYSAGDEITVVSVADQDGNAPRALLRHKRLYGINGELDGVATIEIFFPYRPEPTDADEDGTREVEIADPHSELLVVDLTKLYARLAMTREERAPLMADLKEEEDEMIAAWLAHVREYAPIQSRFTKPPAAPVPRTRRPQA